MGAGQIVIPRNPVLRGLPRELRRARLRAARTYTPGSIPRRAILNGYWDHGAIVRRHMERDDGGNQGES